MYFAGHVLKPSEKRERESSEGGSSGDTVAKTGQKVLRSDSPTFKLSAGSGLVLSLFNSSVFFEKTRRNNLILLYFLRRLEGRTLNVWVNALFLH